MALIGPFFVGFYGALSAVIATMRQTKRSANVHTFFWMQRSALLFFVLSFVLLMQGCASFKGEPPRPSAVWPAGQNQVSLRLHKQYVEWQGAAHRTGGLSKSGIDCSGFTMLTFKEQFAISLPRTTYEQARLGYPVTKNNLLTGDLVFFRTPRTAHVGVYVGQQQFMHVSRKEGVTLSSLSNPYWKKYYWTSRRLNLQHVAGL